MRTSQPVSSVNVVCDFLSGMLTAAAIEAALIRRAREGGSYRVTVTLAQTTTFEMSLGLNDKADLAAIDTLGPDHQIQQPNLVTRNTPFGEFTRLGSQIEMSETPEFWDDPILVPMGSSRPEWRPRTQDVPMPHQRIGAQATQDAPRREGRLIDLINLDRPIRFLAQTVRPGHCRQPGRDSSRHGTAYPPCAYFFRYL
jgi:hypothetical protein